MCSVWLLLLLLQAPSGLVTLQSSCSEFVCTVIDWNPVLKSSFTLKRDPAQFMFMKFVNLQTLTLNLAMLEEKGLLENYTTIKSSPLQSVFLPSATKLMALSVEETDLIYVTVGQNNTHLSTLCIRDSRLRAIPVTVPNLLAVKRIDITFSRIQTVQFALFAKLPHLTVLTLDYNLILHLLYSPSSDEDFPKLQELYLSHNLLQTVNFSYFNTMPALEALYLSDNQIFDVEQRPLLTPSLKFLELSHNSIVRINTCNWTVSSLLNFGIHNNSLKQLPTCLEETMASVRYLHMSYNSMSDGGIWSRLVSLKHLRILDVGYNRFTGLVLDSVIPSLKYLNLQHNPVTQLKVTAANDGLTINVLCGRIAEFDPTNVTHSVVALDMQYCPLDCSWDRRSNNERMKDAWKAQCVRNDDTKRAWYFRISKYCGEHLIVGNEVHWEPLDGDSDEDSADESYHPAYVGETAGSTGTSSWRQRTPPNEPTAANDGIANGSANDVPDEQPSGHDPNDGGEDLRDESLVTLQERHYDAAGSPPYRRLVRAGAVGEPRAEALQAATVHSFHNLKILKPSTGDDDDEEAALERHQQQKHSQQQQQHQTSSNQQQQLHNETDLDRNQQEAEAATRSRNRQRQKVFSQDFRVLKILPSNLDVVEDIKQIGNEYYFKKDVEVVIDDRENEIVDSESGSKAGDKGQPLAVATNSTTTGGDGDTGDMTETLDIVVLPAPTKDIEIYDNDLVPDGETGSSRPDDDDDDGDDISVIGLISPTRTAVTTTSSMTTASGGFEGSRLSTSSSSTPLPPTVETTLGHWDVDRLDLPVPAEEENRTNFTVDERTAPTPPFSFNNRTFQTIQETVRKEFDENQGPYPPVGNYDEEEDFDDEDEADEDERGEQEGRDGVRTSGPTGRLDKSHKKHMSVQRTLLKHPLRQGFLMTPSYPKYYIGDSTCRWTLYAGVHQRIKLTVLDLALRYDDECRDYLQVVDLNTNQTLFHSCTESSRPIEIVSIQERLEVSVRTTTKVIYPKRGVLVHYTALGCELPSPTPGHMRLVRRTEHRVKYVCDPLHVFPDTGESVRELICTAKHTWNRPLPACIEKRATEGSGLVSHYEQKRRYGDTDNMSDKQADTVYDILIPSLIIAGLFVVNGIVFAVIMRYRNKRKQRLDLESKELAEL